MKKLVFLILLMGVVVSLSQVDCIEYVNLAEAKLAPPYPNYFGAAGEYAHAAECYEADFDEANMNEYYVKAAEHYIIAAEQLVEGGDNFLRAQSYELAADSYVKVGLKASAIQYYDKAKAIYDLFGYSAEANVVSEKTALLTQPVEEIDWNFIISVIAIIALIVAIFSVLSVLSKGKQSKPRAERFQRQIKRSQSAIVKRRREDFVAPPPKPKPVEPKEMTLTPKEKMAKKLREKYMPKQ